ncbi:orotidine-5'-phosphate decarboxylase [Kiloniella sp. EL199]|uniref:orotidine-5'-phosphate decarboxylase n=1 Tax=Kiloniella sp. EL199 TaxID=2107581 RepID=UPI000EA111DA|nr:orotidine-5'-phosphate decarboxylase [Kiloniella sp. EL199]
MTFFETLSEAPCDALTKCVGIDPTQDTLSAWGLDDTAAGARAFALTMLEAAHNNAPIVKPQIAYFERFGVEGYSVLTDIIKEAKDMGLLVLADVKRGDIGSTIDAYSQAWLGDKAPMQVDAITVTPYLGFGSLTPLLDRAYDTGAYVFVVARSSNPEGTTLQEHGNPKLWQTILDDIGTWEANRGNKTIGAVVGATVPADLKYALEQLPNAYFLAPGIGKQGARLENIKALTPDLKRIVVSSSRGLAAAGPKIADIREAIIQM